MQKNYIVLMLLASIAMPNLVNAQNPNQNVLRQPHIEGGIRSQVVPDLPYLPRYAGNKPIVESVVTYKRHGGQACTICYDTMESGDDILAFYKSAFKDNKWKATSEAPGQLSYTKAKEGLSCIITTKPPGRPDRRARLWIGYSFKVPQLEDTANERKQ